MRAMILAAGRGERMRPLTDTTPKPLLEAGGKPLILWHIDRLIGAGITELVVNLSWLGPRIVAALGDGARFGARIRYSDEPSPLETAGGIANATDLLGEQPFLVINGDIWCDWDPSQAHDIARSLQAGREQAWLLLTRNPPHHPLGDFRLGTDGAVSDRDPCAPDDALTFTGIGIYRPDLFAGIGKGRPAPLAPLLRHAMEQGRVKGRRFTGQWIDIGTPQRLSALNRQLAQ